MLSGGVVAGLGRGECVMDLVNLEFQSRLLGFEQGWDCERSVFSRTHCWKSLSLPGMVFCSV